MRENISRSLRWLFSFLKRQINKNTRLKSLLYDGTNEDFFTDLDYQEVMLSDGIRVDAYHRAISRVVNEGDTVFDLGSGTGILAMFAAKCGAEKVYAIEHGAIIKVAQKVTEQNGFTNIAFANKNSREFSAEELGDVIIHEQMGGWLFNENMIENLLDLKARVLKPGGLILPARFQLFLEPISLKDQHRVPFCWEQPIHGVDFSCLKAEVENDSFRRGSGYRFPENGSIESYRCNPAPLFEFDLNEIDEPGDIPMEMEATKVVSNEGRVDGLSLYFKVIFDDDLYFDTGLDSPRTHWGSPFYRIPAVHLRKGEKLTISLKIGDLKDPDTWITACTPKSVELSGDFETLAATEEDKCGSTDQAVLAGV